MAEITKEKAKNLMAIFLPKYNSEMKTDYIFDSVDIVSNDYDIICVNKRNKKDIFRIQVVEAVPVRNTKERKELTELKKFERGEIDETVALHLQTDELRIEEALGHKFNKYPNNTQKDLIILIDFGLFPWQDENLINIKKAAEQFKGNFKAVYCIHEGQKKCEKLI